MAYVSLQAEVCCVVIKNGRLRFQAFRYNSNGEIIDQVTISLPLELAHEFCNVKNIDKEQIEIIPGMKISRNRLENFALDENWENLGK